MDTDEGTREDHLFLVLDNLLAEHRLWADGPDGQLSREDGFYRAVEETVELFGDGDIPGRLREVERTVTALSVEWLEYLDRVDQFADPNALPNSKFWKLVELLTGQRESAAPAKRFSLEPIKDLIDQKVPHHQICKIYGWVDGRGNPELWRLQEELKTPGTHAGADFVPPLERERLAVEAKQKETVRKLQAKIRQKVKAANEPAQESVEALGRQGVFIRQIAKMKKMRPDQVIAELTALGVDPLPPMDAAAALQAKREYPEGEVGEARRRVDEASSRPLRRESAPEQQFAESESPEDALGDDDELPAGAEAIDEPADALEMLDASDREAAELGEQLGGVPIEQEIIALHLDGMTDQNIAKAVGESIGKIRHTLKAYEKDPSKFAVEA